MALDEGTRPATRRKKRRPVYRSSDSGEAARFLREAEAKARRDHARTQAARGEAQQRAYTDPRAFRSAAGRERLISAAHEEQGRRHAREAQERALTLRGLVQNRKAREKAFREGQLDAEAYQAENAADRRRGEELGLFRPVKSSGASLPIQAIAELAETALYTPAGVYEAGKAVTGDVRDIATGKDFTPSRSAKLGELVARQTYADLRHPLRHPGFAALSALGVAAGGAGAVSRLAAAGKAAAAASGPSRVTQALARKPSEGGSLLRRPAPGRVQIAEGVHRNLSPNVLARQVQRGSIAMKQRLPESRMAGVPGRNLQETVGFERRRTEQILSDMDRAEAGGLKQRGRKAGDVVNRAVMVVGERTPIAGRIATAEADLAKVTGSGPRARAHRTRLTDEIKLLRQVEASGLIENVDGVPRPTAKLNALYGRTVKSGGRREGIIEELGMRSQEQLEARRAAPGRVFEGATFERTRAQSARPVAHVREYQIPEKQRERPRTEAEAKERLAALDKAYDETVDGIAAQLSGGVHDVGEQARRNLANIKRGKGKRRGKAKLETVKQELRGMAEERLSQLLETRRSDPEVARVAELVEERQRLRETLSDPERHFGERKTETGEFGQVSFTTPERTMRRRFPERERRPATAGLRGADDVPPGELFVSYADKRRIKTGRPRPGTEKGMGAPRGNILHGEFTGEAIHQGRVPRDVIERVAEGEMEAQRHATVLRLHGTAIRESVGPDEYLALPSKVREHYRPVRVEAKPYSPDTRRFIDEIEEKKERGQRLTREERGELDSVTERARAHFFPPKQEMSIDMALAAAEKGEVRFFDQRRFGGMNQPQQPITTIGKKAATVFDEFNSAKDIGDLFLRPAYVPANMAQQAAVTLVAGVGPLDVALVARLKRLPPELKARMHGASGVGIAEGMPRERGRLVRGVRNVMARKIGRVMDDEFRNLTFAKNARMLGYNTPEKIARLLDSQAKGKVLDDLVEAAKRTRDDSLDYQRLGNQERMVVSRAIRFYPFLKASGVYTGKFVRDHPIQATVLLQLSREGKEAAEEVLGKLPFYRRGMFSTGIDAKEVPQVVDPRAAQQFESPVQAGTLIEGVAKGLGAEVGLFSDAEAKAAREKLTLGDLVSPGIQAARDLVDPRNRLTGQALTYGEAFRENQRSSVDRFIERMFRPPDPVEEEGKQLPSSRGIELRRFLAGAVFTPRPANVEEMNRAAAEEGAVGLAAHEKAFRSVFKERTSFWEAAKNVAPEALEDGKLPEGLREAFNRKATVARLRARIDSDTDPGVDRELAKFEGEVKLLGEWGILQSAKVGTALRWAQTAPSSEIAKYRRKLSSSPDYFPGAYLDRILKARTFLRDKGADL